MPAYAVAALYRFVRLPEAADLRATLRDAMEAAELCGTLLLAEEGINATLAGPPEALRAFVAWLKADPHFRGRFADLDVKWSTADEKPFRKAKVRLKKEIVTLGVPGLCPADPDTVGTYADPHEWNRLLDDPDVTVVDTRNEYEVELGTFESARGPAVNPHTESFGQLPAFVEQHLDPKKHRKVAMFCTGGIRCEKSTALLKAKGFDQVYHLRGGILNYLETVPEQESKFRGACYVFDRRVAVTHGLKETDHELCFACGWPTTPQDRTLPDYIPGVRCPRCVDRHTPEQIARFRMRQNQHRSTTGCGPANK
jgi:UPF0176 protein